MRSNSPAMTAHTKWAVPPPPHDASIWDGRLRPYRVGLHTLLRLLKEPPEGCGHIVPCDPSSYHLP
jgi:hypothetical protein